MEKLTQKLGKGKMSVQSSDTNLSDSELTDSMNEKKFK